jgi:hypothetical protein
MVWLIWRQWQVTQMKLAAPRIVAWNWCRSKLLLALVLELTPFYGRFIVTNQGVMTLLATDDVSGL